PVVEALVIRGVPHSTAAKCVWFLLQVITAGIVIVAALALASKAGTWQAQFERYLDGGVHLLKQTSASLEKVVPMFKKMGLADHLNHNAEQFTDQFAAKNLLPVILMVVKWLPSLLLIPYLTYFMLSDSARMKKYLMRSVPNAFFEKA